MNGEGHCHAGEGELGQRRAMIGGSRHQREREREMDIPLRDLSEVGWIRGWAESDPAAFLLFFISFSFSFSWILVYFKTFANLVQNNSNKFLNYSNNPSNVLN
jgi:hypothetical protein